jgi:hypothetical protein
MAGLKRKTPLLIEYRGFLLGGTNGTGDCYCMNEPMLTAV